MAESTALVCLERLCDVVVPCFEDDFLRAPTVTDLKKTLRSSEKRGFPGMFGSIDCAKWKWKNCPTYLKGQYEGKESTPTVTMECIADDRLWIWHMFFGMPGGANDINVLNASTLQNKTINGSYPPAIDYVIDGMTRNKPYSIADGIYPKWLCFVQTVSHPITIKEKLMASKQRGARKDVERAFGVLQARWHKLRRPSGFWTLHTMQKVVRCCVILHNVMVEYRDTDAGETKR